MSLFFAKFMHACFFPNCCFLPTLFFHRFWFVLPWCFSTQKYTSEIIYCKSSSQISRCTRYLGASSTTSAGWSAPMLARQAPLQLIYFCILFKERKNGSNNKKSSNIQIKMKRTRMFYIISTACTLLSFFSFRMNLAQHFFYI